MVKLQCYLSIALISVFCIFTRLEAHSKQDSDSMKLRLINTLFRHGDRTIDPKFGEAYPNDPYKNCDSYPDGDGQLTNQGKKRMYRYGEVLRKKYDAFLGDNYYMPNVYARGTIFTRTQMSLQLVLAGIYPPSHIQKWNAHLAWQPVKMLYGSTNDGLMIPSFCSKYQDELKKVKASPEVLAEQKQFDDFMKELTKYTGKNITNTKDLFDMYHVLTAEHYMGLRLPKWTQNIFPHGRLLDGIIFQYKLYSFNDELIRLNGGVILYKMIEDMKEVINGTLKDRRINLLSGHDINVVALLQALGIFNNIYPEFSSSIIIELLEQNDHYFVKILHYLGIPSEIVEMQIPGCAVLCPFEKFVKLTSNKTASAEEDPKCPRTIYDIETIDDNYWQTITT